MFMHKTEEAVVISTNKEKKINYNDKPTRFILDFVETVIKRDSLLP